MVGPTTITYETPKRPPLGAAAVHSGKLVTDWAFAPGMADLYTHTVNSGGVATRPPWGLKRGEMVRVRGIVALGLAGALTLAGAFSTGAVADHDNGNGTGHDGSTTTTSSTTTSSTTTSTTSTSTTTTTAPAAGTVEGGSRMVLAGVHQDRVLVTWTCAAVADFPATAVSVNSCQLTQNGVPIGFAFPVSLPGLVAATANDKVVKVGDGPLDVCWTVSATFVDSTSTSQSGCGLGILAIIPL